MEIAHEKDESQTRKQEGVAPAPFRHACFLYFRRDRLYGLTEDFKGDVRLRDSESEREPRPDPMHHRVDSGERGGVSDADRPGGRPGGGPGGVHPGL